MPHRCKLTFNLLTLKVVSESHVTWPTSVPILVFLSLSVLDLGPMYATDRRQTSDRQTSDAHHRLMSPSLRGIITPCISCITAFVACRLDYCNYLLHDITDSLFRTIPQLGMKMASSVGSAARYMLV